MSDIEVVERASWRRTRWKNDGGWTTEIARSPREGADFRWRISIAEIEVDGAFSTFAGVDRDLLLLEGNGIELDIDDAPPLRLQRRFEHARFRGEADVRCRLLAGPTRDFNVMARRDSVRAEVSARPLVGAMVIFAEAGAEWFVHVHSGVLSARCGERALALAAGASLRVDFRAADAAPRIVLDGSGELLLVRFAAVG